MLRTFFRRALQISALPMSALLVAVFALLMAASVRAQSPIPPLTSPVVDITGTLSAAEIVQLEQQALALQQRKGSQLQILIVPTTRPETIEDYAQRVFDIWKLGRKDVDDGVLLLVAKDDRTVRIQPGYGLEGAIPDITAGRVIQEYLVPRFRAGDFAGGIGDATSQLVRLIDGEPLPEPMAAVGGKPDWVPVAFLVFFISMFLRLMMGRVPVVPRMMIIGAVAGSMLLFFSAPWPVVLAGALVGALIGLIVGISMDNGAFARNEDWGGMSDGASGGWSSSSSSGSSSSSSSSSDWSGGGGSSGGGGASGSW